MDPRKLDQVPPPPPSSAQLKQEKQREQKQEKDKQKEEKREEPKKVKPARQCGQCAACNRSEDCGVCDNCVVCTANLSLKVILLSSATLAPDLPSNLQMYCPTLQIYFKSPVWRVPVIFRPSFDLLPIWAIFDDKATVKTIPKLYTAFQMQGKIFIDFWDEQAWFPHG